MTATAPDYDEIVRVVQLYVDAFNECDINKFKEAFADDAWIFFTDSASITCPPRQILSASPGLTSTRCCA